MSGAWLKEWLCLSVQPRTRTAGAAVSIVQLMDINPFTCRAALSPAPGVQLVLAACTASQKCWRRSDCQLLGLPRTRRAVQGSAGCRDVPVKGTGVL